MKNKQSVKKFDYGKFELSSELKSFISIIWRIVFMKF